MSLKIALEKVYDKKLQRGFFWYYRAIGEFHVKKSEYFSTLWTLADKTYAKKVVIWQQNFTAVLSRTANPVNGLAQYSDGNDLKQGPWRSRFAFRQNECTWNPSELVKGKKLQEKNELLTKVWMSANFPQLPNSLRNGRKSLELIHESYKAPRQCSEVLHWQNYQVGCKSFRL